MEADLLSINSHAEFQFKLLSNYVILASLCFSYSNLENWQIMEFSVLYPGVQNTSNVVDRL